MNIQTVRDNLKNTIASKEALLTRSKARLVQRPVPDDVTWFTIKSTVEFLEINLTELKKILADVELCMNHADSNSWITNPDRMGGQFTQDEIDESTGWR